MAPDSDEWFRQAQYDLGTAESLVSAERYPPAIFYSHLTLLKIPESVVRGEIQRYSG